MPTGLVTLNHDTWVSPPATSLRMPAPPSLNGMWIELEPAGALGQDFGVDVLVGADAAGGVAHVARMRLGVGDELGEGLGRKVRRGGEEEHRRVGGARDDLHVAVVVDVHALGEQHRREAIGRDVADHDGVAVGLGARHFLDGDDAGGAGLVLDQDVLAERLAQMLGVVPRHHVGQAAGRVGDQDADRLVRVGAPAPKRRSRQNEAATDTETRTMPPRRSADCRKRLRPMQAHALAGTASRHSGRASGAPTRNRSKARALALDSGFARSRSAPE